MNDDNVGLDSADNDDEADAQEVRGVVAILDRLFHRYYCAQYEIAVHQKGRVTLTAFCLWLEENLAEFAGEDLCADLNVDVNCWATLRDLIETRQLGSRIARIWYAIALSDRPPAAPAIRTVTQALIITYEDGAIANLQSYMPYHLMPSLQNVSWSQDASVAAAVHEAGSVLAQTIAEQSLQELWAAASTVVFNAPDGLPDPYEVFCGAVLQLLPTLHPGVQPGVQNYLRLFQTLVRPPLSPQILEAFQERFAPPGGPVRGGF